MNSQGMTN